MSTLNDRVPEHIGPVTLHWNEVALSHALRALHEGYPSGYRCFREAVDEAIRVMPKPKPKEPTGLGAVVEDAEGRKFVRGPGDGIHLWVTTIDHSALWHSYSEINAVRVLSEGVQS